jgi:hypothetical protein
MVGRLHNGRAFAKIGESLKRYDHRKKLALVSWKMLLSFIPRQIFSSQEGSISEPVT